MSHAEIIDYLARIKTRYPDHFRRVRVLDCGSLDINGCNRDIWGVESGYTGIDIVPGKNVHIVMPIENAGWQDEHFHVVISTECFEHNPMWQSGLQNMVRMLRPGGLLIVTCATTGRHEHRNENGYYKNLTEADIRAAIDPADFSVMEFEVNHERHDLYFHAVKKGEFVSGCLCPALTHDLAHADIVLPEVVTVLAPGPNGKDYWSMAEGCIIAVNRAVQIPVKASWWIVADGKAIGLDWFQFGDKNFRGKRAFSQGINNKGYKCDYTFKLHKMDWDWKHNCPVDYEYRPDYFRGTESVSGIAIEFACRYGARLVKLIGVDLEGGYYDEPEDDLYTRVPCIFRETIPKMMKYWKKRGVKFELVSPSAMRMDLAE